MRNRIYEARDYHTYTQYVEVERPLTSSRSSTLFALIFQPRECRRKHVVAHFGALASEHVFKCLSDALHIRLVSALQINLASISLTLKVGMDCEFVGRGQGQKRPLQRYNNSASYKVACTQYLGQMTWLREYT